MKKTMSFVVGMFLLVIVLGIIKLSFAELSGELNGSKYINIYLGICCDLPGWNYDVLFEEKIPEENSLTENGQEEEATAREGNNIVIMSASSSDLLQKASIEIKNAANYRDIYEMVGMEKAISWMKNDFSLLIKSMNAYDVFIDQIDIQIDGETFYGLSAEFRYMTIPVYIKQLYFFQDDYLVFLTFSSYKKDKTEDIIKQFNLAGRP